MKKWEWMWRISAAVVVICGNMPFVFKHVQLDQVDSIKAVLALIDVIALAVAIYASVKKWTYKEDQSPSYVWEKR